MRPMRFIFNPEHDLCVANGDPHFVPPASALEFGENCSDVVRWMEGLERGFEGMYQVLPWGWNTMLKCNLLKEGYLSSYLPSDNEIARIRELSHRKYAIEAMNFIKRVNVDFQWPEAAVFISDLGQLRDYLTLHDKIVLKSPLSGSGKGLRWVTSHLSESDQGWCKNIIVKYGGVIVEERYDVVQDCAMLFRCAGASVEFAGYSLFYTENGQYTSNLLASNDLIVEKLSHFIDVEVLLVVKKALLAYLKMRFAGNYNGYIGVDQFVYRRDDNFLFHPAVEINVRMTMGLLARNIFDNHIDTIARMAGGKIIDGEQIMKVYYRRQKRELLNELSCSSSIFTLCKLDEQSRYSIILQNR